MTQDWLYKISNLVLIENTVLSDLVRFTIAVMAIFVAAMLGKMYHEHKTGHMPKSAAIGAVATYVAVGYAQIIALSTPDSTDVTFLNVVVFGAIATSLVGIFQVMDLKLFKRKDH